MEGPARPGVSPCPPLAQTALNSAHPSTLTLLSCSEGRVTGLPNLLPSGREPALLTPSSECQQPSGHVTCSAPPGSWSSWLGRGSISQTPLSTLLGQCKQTSLRWCLSHLVSAHTSCWGKASSRAAVMPLAWGRPSLHTGSPQYPAVLTRTSRPGPEPAAGSDSCSKGRTPPTLLTSLGEKQFLRELGHPHADLEFLVPR